MKRKTTYTKKLHAYRVSLMMKRVEYKKITIRGCCPAAKGFEFSKRHLVAWECSNPRSHSCGVCRKFVEAPVESCPCWALGEKKAISKTKSALKEYYKK